MKSAIPEAEKAFWRRYAADLQETIHAEVWF